MSDQTIETDLSRLLIHASQNDWCWKIPCATCGNRKLRTALLKAGRLPQSLETIEVDISSNAASNVLSIEQLMAFQSLNLLELSPQLRFPDWLGILGVAMTLTPPSDNRLNPNWLIFDPIRHFLHETDCRGIDTLLKGLAEQNWKIDYKSLMQVKSTILDSYGVLPDFTQPPIWCGYADAVNQDILRGPEFDLMPDEARYDHDDDFSLVRAARAAKYRSPNN